MDTTSTALLLSKSNELLASHSARIDRVRTSQQKHRRLLQALSSPPEELLQLPCVPSSPLLPPLDDDLDFGFGTSTTATASSSRNSLDLNFDPTGESQLQQFQRQDLPPHKQARVQRYPSYVPDEETIRNDYSQRYVDGGEWPQNWVLGAEPEHRFEEYPKQQRLLTLKKNSVNNHSTPPYYLPFSQLSTLHPNKFDVILLDPPFSSSFTWDHLQELPIPSLAADPSFVFLWVGSGAGEGLERGREVLAKWGYRRCEDVCWVKTNKTTNQGPGTDPPTTSLLTRTKQHCLIGIRGTVRRSTDSWFVHCNVDTDVIIWEGDPSDPTRKPPEMYTLIENFCLGLRRVEIFGRQSSLRRGWVTVLSKNQEPSSSSSSSSPSSLRNQNQNQSGNSNDNEDDGIIQINNDETGKTIATKWKQEEWDEKLKQLVGVGGVGIGSSGNIQNGKMVVPMTSEIEALRPKSPARFGGAGGGGGGQNNNNSNSGMTMAMPMSMSSGGGGGGGGGVMSGGVAVGIPNNNNNNNNNGNNNNSGGGNRFINSSSGGSGGVPLGLPGGIGMGGGRGGGGGGGQSGFVNHAAVLAAAAHQHGHGMLGGQNHQMMVQPGLMGMNMGMGNMGMGNMGMGMGNLGVGMGGMGNLGVGGMGMGMGNLGMAGLGMGMGLPGVGSMQGVNHQHQHQLGMGMGVPMDGSGGGTGAGTGAGVGGVGGTGTGTGWNPMMNMNVPMGVGHMNMGMGMGGMQNPGHTHGTGVGGFGNMNVQGVFNPAAMNNSAMGWGDQGHMNMGGMNMGGMNGMHGNNMGGQWGGF